VERQRKKGREVERWERKMEVYKPKQENLKARLEKNARVCVDLGRRGEVLVRAVEACVEPVGGMQGRRRTQGQGSSFEPTLPGATEREDTPLDDADGGEGPAANILGNFKARRQQDLDSWTVQSLYDRYAMDKGYADFRQQEFEGYNDDEEQDPPSPEKWFETEEPAPGTATQGAADESDDDVQIARAKISTKCPLTLQEFKDPVMSTVCKHTFEKSAIDEMIGRRAQVQCPVGGCPNVRTLVLSHFLVLPLTRHSTSRAPNSSLTTSSSARSAASSNHATVTAKNLTMMTMVRLVARTLTRPSYSPMTVRVKLEASRAWMRM
jgi:hypothetical protein